MLFPESDRVVYDTNQLVEVICEVRYPQILRIDSEIPAGFQDRIRSEYPITEKGPCVKFELPRELAKALPLELNFGDGPPVYSFSTPDKAWSVGLTSGSLSVSTRTYQRWEDFKRHLDGPLSAFVEEYKPAFFSRVGLRYRNVISPKALGLDESELPTLLKRHIAGVLADPEIAPGIRGATQQLVFELPDDVGLARVTHGLATRSEPPERCYAIDNDLFTEAQVEVTNAVERLDLFNAIAARIFRWCISDRLHAAMGPRLV